MFQGREERFGRGIVETRADTPHRLANIELAADFGEVVGSVGRTAIRVEDHPGPLSFPAASGDGHLYRLTCEFGVRMTAGGVAQQPAREQVDRGRKVQFTL